MAKIAVNIRNFKDDYADLNGQHTLEVSRRAVLRSALMLGFQDYSHFGSAVEGLKRHRYLSGLSALNCLRQVAGNWVLEDFHDELDGSEKGPESYGKGMIFAKLVAEKFLGVRWLSHVDALKAKGELETIADSKQRGDMVGLCQKGRWHVVEAKGRSRSFSDTDVEHAKHQAACVERVAGESPATNSACITSLWTDPIEILLDDPPIDGALSWDFEASEFWTYYYGNLAAYIREQSVEMPFKTAVEKYVFASLSPIFDQLPPEVLNAFSPLPEFIGLPWHIVNDPSSARILLEADRGENILEAGADGVMILGPFGKVERLTRDEQ
ncbi:MAG: hypothetical protein ABI162_05360 [Luteolibacter sp.]